MCLCVCVCLSRLGTGRRVAARRGSALMCLGKASRRDQAGKGAGDAAGLSRLGKVTQRAEGWGLSPSCPRAPSLAQPAPSLPAAAHCAAGQQKGLAEEPSLADHTSLPPAPHGTSLPSRACGLRCSLLAGSESTFSLRRPRGTPQREGLSRLKIRAALAPRLLAHSRVACAGSGTGGSGFEATML